MGEQDVVSPNRVSADFKNVRFYKCYLTVPRLEPKINRIKLNKTYLKEHKVKLELVKSHNLHVIMLSVL